MADIVFLVTKDWAGGVDVLGIGGAMGEQGRRFFAARKALGIEGYATQEEAEKQIRQRVIITKG